MDNNIAEWLVDMLDQWLEGSKKLSVELDMLKKKDSFHRDFRELPGFHLQ